MYNWRKMGQKQREFVLQNRRQQGRPWHSPHHDQGGKTRFHLTAACYEHQPVIGRTIERMTSFENELLGILDEHTEQIFAWATLPNHWHSLVYCNDIEKLLKELFRFHGRSSYEWNGEDDSRGRKVWCNAVETGIKSDRHFWAVLNYIHHNPVRHGYAERWQDWPFSSAQTFLNDIGRERAVEIWREYDISRMGIDWDLD